MLFSYDSEKVLRGFSFNLGNNWIPILNLQEEYHDESTTFWVVGIQDEELYGVELKHGYVEPLVYPKPAFKLYKFNIPLLSFPQNETKSNDTHRVFEEKILRNLMFLNHEIWRKNKYSIHKDVRTYQQPEQYYSDGIKDDNDLNNLKKDHDKSVLATMKDYIIEGFPEKVIDLYSSLMLQKSKSLCITLLQNLNQNKIIEILNKRILVEQFKETDSLTVNVKDNYAEKMNLIEPVIKESKNSLSDFAVNLVNFYIYLLGPVKKCRRRSKKHENHKKRIREEI
jgi:hypothetical protein